ncbi:LysR family transcriptional regulator [Marinomonas posidonica]|uniref:Transcriptional regulator, LysR family n=1 Tax=Marinomonas posidonica (strain CECT 7376 / NCIMB 14433 / IVIA-Po-181) TaxID=491952 RepID=F6CRS9_MARPP|nr:LysR family transcriptional regulator [Marinomonas posidonica]AEF54932.1 transcriptional regulator, LysR family [Marinomonas posidonica IVIA-Po-181]
MLDIAELITFIKVAETHSFSDAATRLFVTQPAVSKRIAALESNLGVKLFDRIGRQVQLTEAGIRLLPKAKKMAEDLEDIKRSMTLQMQDVSGELRLSTSHHVGLHRLPDSLKRFQQDYPSAQLEIEFTQSEEAYQDVLKGHAELAVITLSNKENSLLESIPIWSDPLTCVVSKDHPLTLLDQISLVDLAEYPCVLPNKNTFTRQIAEQVFGKQGLKPQVRMNTNNLETLAMLVSIGWGWSLLPSTLVDDRLTVLNFPELNVERKLGVLHHKQKTLSRAANAFITLLKQASH